MRMEETSGPSDAEVVARVRDGDDDAYRVLVRRYQDVLYRHALRMTSNPDVATDMVQASFIKAYRHIHRCEPERFGGWIFRIVSNRTKDYLRGRARNDVSLEDAPTQEGGEDPADDLHRKELRVVIERSLAQLPDEQREAFVLKHVEGRSYEEMSELLEASVPALKMRVHRAREALRTLMQEVME
ncbi:MAG TPA: sigma-70 family RNA polymerase sigma factor [Longimicrobiales bacterium]|nr:sigma-70 family RNA polymerase sigma factor [Longimicrobiales bacterium]